MVVNKYLEVFAFPLPMRGEDVERPPAGPSLDERVGNIFLSDVLSDT